MKKIHLFYFGMMIVCLLMTAFLIDLPYILRQTLVSNLGLGRIFPDIFYGVYTLIVLGALFFTFSAVQENGKIRFSLKAVKRRMWHVFLAYFPIFLFSLLIFALNHP